MSIKNIIIVYYWNFEMKIEMCKLKKSDIIVYV